MKAHFENLDTENRRQQNSPDSIPEYLKHLAERYNLDTEHLLVLEQHLPEFESAADCRATLESFLAFAF